MAIETDKARVLSGVRFGVTIGSPVALTIGNRDWDNWTDVMAVAGEQARRKPSCRPPARPCGPRRGAEDRL